MPVFKNEVAFVTGGAQGIGRAIVERLRRDGAAVMLADIDVARGQGLADEVGAEFVECDVTVESQVSDAVKATVERCGGLDILVNNAGINAYFDPVTMTERDWESVFAVDLKGAWLCSKHAFPIMEGRGGGSIVNIASVHALMTMEGTFPYAAAKSGLIGVTRGLALDFGNAGVRVNAVCPGYIQTRLLDEWFGREEDPADAKRRVAELHALRRIGTPQDVAAVVAFLASSDAGFITGASITVDGGLTTRFAS